jgi:hypothetical protein
MLRALVAAALLVSAGPAAARAADVGGGTAPNGLHAYRSALTIVTVRRAGDGSAIVRATIAARCGVAHVKRSGVKVAADGSFAFAATVGDHPLEAPGVRRSARVSIRGQLAATGAAGTAGARLRLERHGRVVARCKSGARAWQARPRAPQAVAGPPRAGGAYYGLAAQTGRPRGVVLRVGPSGRRVRVAAFEYRARCRHRSRERDNVMSGGPIAADRTFDLHERFTIRYANASERYRVRFHGRFTPTGVRGALSVTSVARSRSGALIDRCRTGRVSYSGAL